MSFSTKQLSIMQRHNINCLMVKALENNEVPWQKPWEGRGKNIGFPKCAFTHKKFFGINVLLLQMAAKRHKFVSQWWASSDQFARMGATVKPRPRNVAPGEWGTGIIFYKSEDDDILTTSAVMYNAEQLQSPIKEFDTDSVLAPNYFLAERVLHATTARINYNDNDEDEAWYFYPPHDFISIPPKRIFEKGLGGLPAYYESLAHELIHWTESRLDFVAEEAITELRADIGAAFLMEELSIPHSISLSNYYKWKGQWLNLMKKDVNLIFKISASACKAVDYILSRSTTAPERYNQLDESAA